MNGKLNKNHPRAKAKALGKKFYMPPKDCPRGHRSLRYTKYGQCLDCLKIFKAKYRASEKGYETELAYAEFYRKINKEKIRLKLYGLSPEQYKLLLNKQNKRCAICKKKLDLSKKTCIDHCHKSKKVRGILCWNCNIGIGHLRHNPKILKSAMFYCS